MSRTIAGLITLAIGVSAGCGPGTAPARKSTDPFGSKQTRPAPPKKDP